MEIHITTGGSGINLQGWATVAVAVVVAAVTTLTYLVNRQKLRLDLFEHRFALYSRLAELVKEMSTIHGDAKSEYIRKVNTCYQEARFLFNDEIADDIRQLRRKLNMFVMITNDYLEIPDTEQHEDARNERLTARYEVGLEIGQQMERIRFGMMPYIGFSQVGIEGETIYKAKALYNRAKVLKHQYKNYVRRAMSGDF